MPGWYKACEIDRSELSSKSICNISCIWSNLGTVLATVPDVQFAVPADWEAPWVWVPSQ